MQWYNYGIIGNWGSYPDPEGLYPKPDINIKAPAGTAFTAVAPGVVTGIDTSSSYGDVVTVRFDTPPNSVATHYEFEHLSSIANIFVGEHVGAGTILGYGGGGQSKSGALPGFGFTDTNVYGTGSVNEPFTGTYVNPLLNPTSFFNQLATGIPGTVADTMTTPGGGNTTGSTTSGCDPNTPVLGFFCQYTDPMSGFSQWLSQAGIIIFGAVIVLLAIFIMFRD